MTHEKNYLFTSESVSEGHPDKVADQISDAILDEFLARDPQSKVACETLVTTGHVTVAGEVKSKAYVDLMETVRGVIARIGYNRSELKFEAESCGVLSALHEQSIDINRGVERAEPEEQGAGDQGMMFGYACDETDTFMPLPLDLSHRLLRELSDIRRNEDAMTYTDRYGVHRTYLRPDAKSQVTVEYTPEGEPVRVHTIVISTQHDEFILPTDGMTQDEADRRMVETITNDVRNVLIPRVKAKLSARVAAMIDDDVILHVNPTGKFVIGGPHGDTGLTGRKIIVDTYGGRGAHGGGAFSGKDPSKVDRSAAYATRWVAKNIVAAGLAKQCEVQVAYAIGVAKPVSIMVDTFGTGTVADEKIEQAVEKVFDLTPAAIIRELDLRKPIYRQLAAYGHMGREDLGVKWENTDRVDALKAAVAAL